MGQSLQDAVENEASLAARVRCGRGSSEQVPEHAVELVRLWHSRLPGCQAGPWQYAFRAHKDDVTYAVALWNNPCTRSLPSHWLELRRMACSPDSPKNTPSRMIAWMVRYFQKACPQREKCISYQDLHVHTGTIYKAAGWAVEYVSKPRIRDRSKKRVGTNRMYRTNKNGIAPDAAAKARWAKPLNDSSQTRGHQATTERRDL